MSQSDIVAVLERKRPARFVYAPNYWQWFAHQQNHGLLPPAIEGCQSQLEMIQRMGLDVFSRNIYCDQQRGWWGGLADDEWTGVDFSICETSDGHDRIMEKTYRTRAGTLMERQRYLFGSSTLVQEKFAVDDFGHQFDILAELVQARRYRFVRSRFESAQRAVGDLGIVVAGEVHSPLKMLHVLVGAQDTTYLLADHPERTAEILALHEEAQLDLIRQMVSSGVRAVMSMDNLDTAFHPPRYVEAYSASFYERASHLCHEHGSLFFIHACGQQRKNLRLIASLGVDGLEGVAFPPFGDVELDEAMQLSGDRLIITGGISAKEFTQLQTREQVFEYVRTLFDRLRPYAHRFMFSASCNTPISAQWQTMLWFRDAWREFGAVA
jgi:hypothetical protein